MPGPGLGSCEVCGVKTNKRCSACTQVGIELFFCSSEHQKLVWKAHKISCGHGTSTSHKPFAVPPLSKQELDRVEKRYTTPFITPHGTTTLQKDLTSLSGLPPFFHLGFLEGPVEGEPILRWKAWIVAACRASDQTLMLRNSESNTPDSRSEVLNTYSVFICLVYRCLMVADLLPHDPTTIPGHTFLTHKLLILSKLLELDTTLEPEHRRNYRTARARVQGWSKNGMLSEDPQFKAAFRHLELLKREDGY